MTLAFKAALLSGLIFPGVGHVVLQKYLRGSILILATLAAVSVIVTVTVRRALILVDDINNGDIPMETAAIIEQVSRSTAGSDNSSVTFAVIVIAACWLFGIVDSYRVGMTFSEHGRGGH